MKKIFITLILLIDSLAGFSQSFSVDPRSMSVPRYANQATITTAITAPTEGMLVFNNALDLFVYYNGTTWVNFPAQSSGQTNPIDSTRIISAARIPSLQALKMAGAIAAPGITPIGRLFNIQSYGQTSTGSILSGEISFRAPAAFSSFNSASDIVFSTKSIASVPLVDRMMIDRDGRFSFGAIPSPYTSRAMVDFNFDTGTDEFPTLLIRGGSSQSVIRYSSSPSGVLSHGIIQTNFMGSSTNAAANAGIAWKHYNDAVSPAVSTPMMSIAGTGNLTVHGFTKHGGSTAFFPATKVALLTGSLATSGLTTTFVHGLDATKIIGYQIIVNGGSTTDLFVSDNNPATGLTFSSSYDATNFFINRSSTNGATLVAKGFKIMVTYTN